jgi:uric acid transporter
VVERAFDQGPFADTHDLRAAFQEALFSGARDEQRDLMSYYPDLGCDRVANGDEGDDSLTDQSTAGLTRLTDTDHEAFGTLTAAYRERFGIPLIVCVRDVEKRDQILRSGWARMDNSDAQEHAAALIEIAKIANHRFDDLVADANPIASARTQRFHQLDR